MGTLVARAPESTESWVVRLVKPFRGRSEVTVKERILIKPRAGYPRHVDNAQLSELLARASEDEEGDRRRALRRAARAAMMWPEEAEALAGQGRLKELRAVGPFVAGSIQQILDED